jgi:hypothetical protein
MSQDATQYRERAEEARQLAEKLKNPLDKEVSTALNRPTDILAS